MILIRPADLTGPVRGGVVLPPASREANVEICQRICMKRRRLSVGGFDRLDPTSRPTNLRSENVRVGNYSGCRGRLRALVGHEVAHQGRCPAVRHPDRRAGRTVRRQMEHVAVGWRIEADV